jgi:hypothetical protein
MLAGVSGKHPKVVEGFPGDFLTDRHAEPGDQYSTVSIVTLGACDTHAICSEGVRGASDRQG